MTQDTKTYDTSTICDQLLHKWMDQYPPEKTAVLQDKYLSLAKPIREYSEKLTALKAAKSTLLSYIGALEPYAAQLDTAVSQIDSYTREMGIVEQGLNFTFKGISESLAKIADEATQYILEFNKAYFSNLRQVEIDIDSLKGLQDFYQTLFNIIVTIRDSYFKTPDDRRKPILRDLCRSFHALASNNRFGNVNPEHRENTSFAVSLDKEEYDSLLSVATNAADTEKILKKSR